MPTVLTPLVGETYRLARATIGTIESTSVALTVIVSVLPFATESGIVVANPWSVEFGSGVPLLSGPDASTAPVLSVTT